MGRKCMPQHPCGVCSDNCKLEDWSVFCDSCQLWFYDHCENLTSEQMEALGTTEEEFLCTSCTETAGEFNFSSSITRLGKAAEGGIAKLRQAIQLESILVRRTTFRSFTREICFSS